ncbi:hypothetical protein AAVH_15688 [Aphelenchoides avenae]|nr:hypothetical protein AAVH_15688 [Aphelenchus avenae]
MEHNHPRTNDAPPANGQFVHARVHVEGTASLAHIYGTDWQHFVDPSLLKGGTNFVHPNAVQRNILSATNQASTSVHAFAPKKSGKTTAFLLGAMQCIAKWHRENAPCTVPGAPLVIFVLPSDALVQETAALLRATASTIPPMVCTGDKLETAIRNLSVVTDMLLATPGKLRVLLGNMHINTAKLVHFIADACEHYITAADLAPLKHVIAKLRSANAHFTISCGGSRVQADFRSFMATPQSAMHVVVTDEEATARCTVQRSEPGVLKFIVPPNVAGCVVGKQGNLLRKLQTETQCEIAISHPAPNGTQEVTIKGAPEAVKHARARMDRAWMQKGAMVRKKIAFLEDFYGLACGANGSELAKFKESYNVNVSLGTRETSEYPDYAWIEFCGFPADVDRACERFQQLMANASSTSVAWPEQVETILVPLSAKRVILDERAVTLRGIQVKELERRMHAVVLLEAEKRILR